MLDDILQSKIDLLIEQIENFEKSGRYTEPEIDLLIKPLKFELGLIQNALAFEFLKLKDLLELNERIKQAIITKRAATPLISNTLRNIGKSLIITIPARTIKYEDYGMTAQSYLEGKKIHNSLFRKVTRLNGDDDIEELDVIDAEILTPNTQEV